jgi:hypothetical protein
MACAMLYSPDKKPDVWPAANAVLTRVMTVMAHQHIAKQRQALLRFHLPAPGVLQLCRTHVHSRQHTANTSALATKQRSAL